MRSSIVFSKPTNPQMLFRTLFTCLAIGAPFNRTAIRTWPTFGIISISVPSFVTTKCVSAVSSAPTVLLRRVAVSSFGSRSSLPRVFTMSFGLKSKVLRTIATFIIMWSTPLSHIPYRLRRAVMILPRKCSISSATVRPIIGIFLSWKGMCRRSFLLIILPNRICK